jgi:hypothetical protein
VQASGAPYASFFLKAYGVLASRPVKIFCFLLQAPFRPLKFARTQMTISAGTPSRRLWYPGPTLSEVSLKGRTLQGHEVSTPPAKSPG